MCVCERVSLCVCVRECVCVCVMALIVECFTGLSFRTQNHVELLHCQSLFEIVLCFWSVEERLYNGFS